ncbi:hypothetical protein ACH4OW_33895 [Streptomyces sp. NPDC017056]|uniref:hypothetical protein n=1 Tax=Streptomyces sp. NPDC017056 TaxID=3364973 RepID=UPI0037909EA3
MAVESRWSILRERLDDARECARELRGRKHVLVEENWRLLDENYRLRRQRARLAGQQRTRE